MGEQDLCSVHNALSLITLLPAQAPPLFQRGVPPTEDKLLQGRSFPQAAVLHKLDQHGPFPQSAVLQEQTSPAWVPHRVLPENLLQCGVSMGCNFLQSISTCSTVDLHGLQGDSLSHHGLLHRLQGNICSGAWSTSSPSFFTDLDVWRIVSLTFSHSSLPVFLTLS